MLLEYPDVQLARNNQVIGAVGHNLRWFMFVAMVDAGTAGSGQCYCLAIGGFRDLSQAGLYVSLFLRRFGCNVPQDARSSLDEGATRAVLITVINIRA
jgi:hypothetical protein